MKVSTGCFFNLVDFETLKTFSFFCDICVLKINMESLLWEVTEFIKMSEKKSINNGIIGHSGTENLVSSKLLSQI